MKKQKILVLMHRDLIPPETATKKIRKEAPWITEFDVVSTLKKLRYPVFTLGVISDLQKISNAIEEIKPDIAFNLLEEFDGEAIFDQNVVSYLELKGVPYTGNSPIGLILGRNKALSKKILAYHRIPIPSFQVFFMKRKIKLRKKLKYPLIVKSLMEEASMGISQASVVTNEKNLIQRVEFIHQNIQTDAIVEEFIEGREIYMGMMGNHRLDIFPPWEMYFGNKSDDTYTLATSRIKHDSIFRKKHKITTDVAQKMNQKTSSLLVNYSRKIYKVLSLSGYARIDYRISPEGIPFVLEVNPNPALSEEEDFAMAAYYGGLSYEKVLEKIIRLGLNRPKYI